MRLKVGLALLVSTIAAASPAAAELRLKSPVLVADLRSKTPTFGVVSVKTINQILGPSTPSPAEILKTACKNVSPEGLGQQRDEASRTARSIIEKLLTCGDCLKAFAEERFYVRSNDEVLLLVLYDSKVINPDDLKPVFLESPRQSELVSTAKALFPLVTAKVKEMGDTESCEAFSYVLMRDRSYFRVQLPEPAKAPVAESTDLLSMAHPPPRRQPAQLRTIAFTTQAPQRPPDRDPPTSLSPPQSAPPAGDNKKAGVPLESPEIVIGPSERLFFSADFSIPKLSRDLITPGEDPVADAERLKQKDFFVALNVSFGDLLIDRNSRIQKRALWKELVVKFQLSPTRKPFDEWGVGLGMRGDRLKALLWNMDVVHPFVGLMRRPVGDSDREWAVTGGFAFDPRSLQKKEK